MEANPIPRHSVSEGIKENTRAEISENQMLKFQSETASLCLLHFFYKNGSILSQNITWLFKLEKLH